MLTLPIVLSATASAASLDLLEVGGAYGTPGATNPSALWWNPAGLAVGGGTQVLVDVAPTFASVAAQRANPDYGELNLTFLGSENYPQSYDYSGTDTLGFSGVVPFVGVSSDFTLPGLGVGLGLAVPTAHGGVSDQEWGANRYAIREGSVQALYVMGGASYQLLDKVAAGVSVAFVDSSWYANTDTSIYPDLAWSVAEAGGQPAPPAAYQDGYIEQRGYTSTLIFGGERADGSHGALKDTTFTFGGGIYVTPIGDKLGISVAFNKGMKLLHEGDLTMRFQCPPDYDGAGRFGAESTGLCDATFQGTGEIGYSLPSRIHLGVVVSPIQKLRLEAMGAYVFWSAFTDFDITSEIAPDQVDVDDPAIAEETADLVSTTRPWARANVDTFWVGVDGKMKFHPLFTGGLRVIYDHSAIPDEVLSPNNYDANTVMLTGLAMLTPVKHLGIGASFGHYFLARRTVTDSAYAVSLAQANPNGDDYYAGAYERDRFYYPSSNGTFSGSINRIGIVLKAQIGKDSGGL